MLKWMNQKLNHLILKDLIIKKHYRFAAKQSVTIINNNLISIVILIHLIRSSSHNLHHRLSHLRLKFTTSTIIILMAIRFTHIQCQRHRLLSILFFL